MCHEIVFNLLLSVMASYMKLNDEQGNACDAHHGYALSATYVCTPCDI